nr:TetR/AcrR family transcriptional regulator C-terminal domain-containing protein [Streptomyces boncukensis]
MNVLLYGYVQGLAVHLERESHAREATGLSEEEWLERHDDGMRTAAASGTYPAYARFLAAVGDEGYDLELDRIFTTGLTCLLDGLEHSPPGAVPGRDRAL